MATGTAGTQARTYHTHQTHYLRKRITFADNGLELSMGWVPAGSTVIRGGVVVTVAFDGNSSNVLDIGTAADTDGFATDIALGTIGVIAADEMATTNDAYCAADTEIKCVVVSTASATAGVGYVWVEYIISQGTD
jgi:hypothetical protein